MRLGIVADTHDNVAAVREIVATFQDRAVDAVLHCGDVVAPPVIPEFDGFEFHLVFGNNDGDRSALREQVAALDQESACHGRFAHLTFDSLRLGMLHGEDLAQVADYARSGAYDYVLHGHHHTTRRDTIDGTVILNPGGHFPTIPEADRCVAILDTESGEDEFIQVSSTVLE